MNKEQLEELFDLVRKEAEVIKKAVSRIDDPYDRLRAVQGAMKELERLVWDGISSGGKPLERKG